MIVWAVYISAASIVGLLLFFVSRYARRFVAEEADTVGAEGQPAGRVAPRPGGGNVRNRRARRNRMDTDSEPEEEEMDFQYDAEGKKVGKKKQLKLQEKHERRLQREAELQEREDRKKRMEEFEKRRKEEEEKEKANEEARLEAERLLKEEQERREHEEYLKMKEHFTVDESGFDETDNDLESDTMLAEFIEFVKKSKVVILEDLASHYKLKTQEIIDRLSDLQESGRIQGVMDDRGKFIYITDEELQAVAKFIKRRGRVTISELVDNSNSLINLDLSITSVS